MPRCAHITLLTLGLAYLVQGYTTFDTNCSLPTREYSFVQSPNTRGSLDILWSCVGVLFACVYSVLHFNLPWTQEQLDGLPFWNPLHMGIRIPPPRFYMQYMEVPLVALGSLIAPEAVYGFGVAQWENARKQLHLLTKSVEDLPSDWRLKHMFFADMGGLVLLYPRRATGRGGYPVSRCEPHINTGSTCQIRLNTFDAYGMDNAYGKAGSSFPTESQHFFSDPRNPALAMSSGGFCRY